MASTLRRRGLLGAAAAAGLSSPALACDPSHRTLLGRLLLPDADACGPTGTGPAASSPFITADFTSAATWPTVGVGQATVSQLLWGVSSSSLAGGFFGAFTDSGITDQLAVVNPSIYYFTNGGAGSFWDSNLNVIPSTLANLVNNFSKVDPLGIAKVIIGADFDLNSGNGLATTANYGTAMGNLASYLFNFTMPNGKKFPLLGITGHNEPDGFGEATTVNYYVPMSQAVKAVSSSLLVVGPSTSTSLWGDFCTQVPLIDIFCWDIFTGPDNELLPFSTAAFTNQPTRFANDAHNNSTGGVNPQPKVGWMIGGYGYGPTNPSQSENSYIGAVWTANRMLQLVDNTNLPFFGGHWGGWDNREYGVVTGRNTQPNQAGAYGITSTINITPKGYMMAKAVRNVYGPRWNVPINSSGLQVCAVTSATGKFALMIVNMNNGARNGTVALSHWPVSVNGNGTANMWQMTSTSTLPNIDGALTPIPVNNGLTGTLSFPDPSVTIIYV